MSILRAPRLPVKPTRHAPLPSEPFGSGLLPINIFDAPADELVASPLPSIDGTGLTQTEAFTINGFGNRARAQYAVDSPEADAIELARVERAARVDGLRSVLRNRPVAPCCDTLEDFPCTGCSSQHIDDLTSNDVVPSVGDIDSNDVIPGSDPEMTPEELELLIELNRENPAGAVEAELEKFPAFTGWPEFTRNFYWSPAEPRLSLVELIELEAQRLRDRGNEAGDLMAGALAELARVVRVVDASRPDQVEARLEVLERDFADPVEFEPELTPAGRYA